MSPPPAGLPADGLLRRWQGPGRSAFLPTPTVQSHAANLAWLPDGDLACVWFGGTQEGVADITAYLSRLPRGSDTWTDPVPVSHDPRRSEQNPVLFAAPDGSVWLLHTAQLAGNQDTSQVVRRVSTDSARTWSAPEVLLPATSTGGVFVRQPPVTLPTGRILLPVFNCVTVPGEKWSGEQDTSSVWRSDDGGVSWVESRVPGSLGCVHMGIVPRSDGSLWATFRSRWADHVYESLSRDDGVSWSEPTPTVLPNNNSSIQAVGLGLGGVALIHNASSALEATERRVSLYDEIDDEGVRDDVDRPQHVAPPGQGGPAGRAFWGAPRAPVTLALSEDGGMTWPVRVDLETGDGYCMSNNSRDGLNRELSYPSVLPGPDGDLHLAWTYHRRAIRHVQLSSSDLAALRSRR